MAQNLVVIENFTDESAQKWTPDDLSPASLNSIYLLMQRWLMIRSTMSESDRDRNFIEKLIVKEIAEALLEHDLEGTSSYDALDHLKEIGDILAFIFPLAISHGIKINFDRVVQYVNGLGKRSAIYDDMTGTALEISDKVGKLEKTIEHLLVQVLSLWVHLPEKVSPEAIIKLVVDKNEINYPAGYFSGRDYKTGKLLSKENQQLQCNHAKRCLRLIRDFSSDNLATHHTHFSDLIRDFKHGEASFRILKDRLGKFYGNNVATTNGGVLVYSRN